MFLSRARQQAVNSQIVAPRETSGREFILSTYAEAIRKRYRFFSYGDAMLIL